MKHNKIFMLASFKYNNDDNHNDDDDDNDHDDDFSPSWPEAGLSHNLLHEVRLKISQMTGGSAETSAQRFLRIRRV